jgi:GNAT superfamily N-acetyltransferase
MPKPFGYTIGLAEPRHLEELPGVELAAATHFRGYDVPPRLFTDTTPLSMFAEAQASGLLWVVTSADGTCAGFGLVSRCERRLHLEEFAVRPEDGRRGVGTALMREIERWAAAHGFAEVTLTTYRDVPWNGPFYRRLGYTVVPPEDLDPELAARREEEAALGFDSMPRVAMRKSIDPGEQERTIDR